MKHRQQVLGAQRLGAVDGDAALHLGIDSVRKTQLLGDDVNNFDQVGAVKIQ
jgi:hypothetical protein